MAISGLTASQEGRGAIEDIRISIEHLLRRLFYKPGGTSGQGLVEGLKALRPEIFSRINDGKVVDLEALTYTMLRQPEGIEAARYVELHTGADYDGADFEVTMPADRIRNCRRIDEQTMAIEISGGLSEIYDIITQLTFLYVESEKLKRAAIDDQGRIRRNWEVLDEIVNGEDERWRDPSDPDFRCLSRILGRSPKETKQTYHKLQEGGRNSGLFKIIYHLGKLAIEEAEGKDREVEFTEALRRTIKFHTYGERWAENISVRVSQVGVHERPAHLISANLHSVLNYLFARSALETNDDFSEVLEVLRGSDEKQKKVMAYALEKGMVYVKDRGTNINVQVIDTTRLDFDLIPDDILPNRDFLALEKPVLINMNYPFGDQAFEVVYELAKAYSVRKVDRFGIKSVNAVGKAGITMGGRGELMIPTYFIVEGSGHVYELKNDFAVEGHFDSGGIKVATGPMLTVLGTSLQNQDVLEYFSQGGWGVVGLEMEGAHMARAILTAKVKGHLPRDVVERFAYYASDNPLDPNDTLATGSLGVDGIRPTYTTVKNVLNRVFQPAA